MELGDKHHYKLCYKDQLELSTEKIYHWVRRLDFHQRLFNLINTLTSRIKGLYLSKTLVRLREFLVQQGTDEHLVELVKLLEVPITDLEVFLEFFLTTGEPVWLTHTAQQLREIKNLEEVDYEKCFGDS